MHERAFGSTGLRVSEVGVGCRGIDGGFGGADDAESRRLIERALALGATYFDLTSDGREGGERAETVVGEVLSGAGARDRVTLASTIALAPGAVAAQTDAIRETLAARLRRLRTDRIDVLFLSPAPGATDEGERIAEGAREALAPLRDAGLFSALGFSAPDATSARAAVLAGGWDALCVRCNVFDRSCVPAMAAAAEAGIAVAVRQPIAEGFLSGKYVDKSRIRAGDPRDALSEARVAELGARAQRLRFLCIKDRPSVARGAVACALAEPGVSVVVAGARTAAQIEDVLLASDSPSPTETELAAARDIAEQQPLGS